MENEVCASRESAICICLPSYTKEGEGWLYQRED